MHTNMRAVVSGRCLVGCKTSIRALDAKRRNFGNASKLPGEDPCNLSFKLYFEGIGFRS